MRITNFHQLMAAVDDALEIVDECAAELGISTADAIAIAYRHPMGARVSDRA